MITVPNKSLSKKRREHTHNLQRQHYGSKWKAKESTHAAWMVMFLCVMFCVYVSVWQMLEFSHESHSRWLEILHMRLPAQNGLKAGVAACDRPIHRCTEHCSKSKQWTFGNWIPFSKEPHGFVSREASDHELEPKRRETHATIDLNGWREAPHCPAFRMRRKSCCTRKIHTRCSLLSLFWPSKFTEMRRLIFKIMKKEFHTLVKAGT